MNRFPRLFGAIVSSKQAAAKGGARPNSLASRLRNRNERIDVPASQPSSAYCKASRPVDCAFGSAICRANSLRCENLLFPIYRARLVFVLYGLTIGSVFSFLQHARREPVYVWIAYLAWSVFICGILSVFAIEYDLLPN